MTYRGTSSIRSAGGQQVTRTRAGPDRRAAPAEAAAERVGLLERHLAECRRLRGGLPG